MMMTRMKFGTVSEMIKFGMGATHIQFDGNCCERDSNDNITEKGLAIGGFESGWLSDLAMVFLLLNTLEMIEETTEHFGMYRDDELAVFRGNLQQSDAAKWLETFQNAVNKIAGNDKLQLTAAAWGKSKKDMPENKKVTVDENTFFPCLDMEMFWTENDDLNFRVHLKPNQ